MSAIYIFLLNNERIINKLNIKLILNLYASLKRHGMPSSDLNSEHEAKECGQERNISKINNVIRYLRDAFFLGQRISIAI